MSFGKKRRQREHLEEQAARGEGLRAWLEERRVAANQRRNLAQAEASQQTPVSRGVDRVPEHLQVEAPEPTTVLQGELGAGGRNHDERRRLGQRGKARHPRRRDIRRMVSDEHREVLAAQRFMTRRAAAERVNGHPAP